MRLVSPPNSPRIMIQFRTQNRQFIWRLSENLLVHLQLERAHCVGTSARFGKIVKIFIWPYVPGHLSLSINRTKTVILITYRALIAAECN